ncbi:hypothetical protein J6590_028011 [Homalodisca vitripennis]|nr:hypothetical protein J6590_028011 [Homalodisca vitripennis]
MSLYIHDQEWVDEISVDSDAFLKDYATEQCDTSSTTSVLGDETDMFQEAHESVRQCSQYNSSVGLHSPTAGPDGSLDLSPLTSSLALSVWPRIPYINDMFLKITILSIFGPDIDHRREYHAQRKYLGLETALGPLFWGAPYKLPVNNCFRNRRQPENDI